MARNRRESSPHRSSGWPLLAVLLAGVVVLGGVILWIGSSLSDDDDPETSYTEAVVGAPSRVNPLFAYANEVDRDLSALVFNGLTRIGPDGAPQPDLAESWNVSADGRSVTFALRSGVKWHSGVAFTAEDVIFTYGLLRDPELQGDPTQAALWQSIDCAARAELSVVCTLPEPYAPFLTYVSVGILPESVLSAATPESLLSDPFNRAPVGTGPYRLESLDEERAVLVANEEFHLGRPGIDRVTLTFHRDFASAAAEVIRGQAGGLFSDLTIEPADYQTLREVETLDRHVAGRSSSTILYFNNETPPLNDPQVREAIAYALDVEAIITGLLGGRGQRADTPIVPGTWAYAPEARMPLHDLGRARDILDEALWPLPEGSAVRVKNNTELRFSLLTDEDPLRGAVAEAIAAQLAEAGIKATVVREPSGDLVNDFLIPREYQAAVYGFDAGADTDPYPGWHSSQAISGGRNIAGYRSDAADALLEEARRTNDMDGSREIYMEFQELFVAEKPSIPLYVPLNTFFLDGVSNVDMGVLFTPSSRFQNVWEWTMDDEITIGQ